MTDIAINLKSVTPAGADRVGRQEPTIGRFKAQTAIKIVIHDFMVPEVVADFIDVVRARKALSDPTNRRIPWEQVKKELGL